MTEKAKACAFCIPEVRDIIDVGQLSIEDRDKVRDALEMIGTRLGCGEAKAICQPLIELSKRVKRTNGDGA